jgi:hypothetical protein
MEYCLSCDTPILEGEQYREMPYVHQVEDYDDKVYRTDIRKIHVECGLRDVIGGYGHLTDHYYWCKQMHDPDGGLSYRESALHVWAWVQEHGVEAAAAIGSE